VLYDNTGLLHVMERGADVWHRMKGLSRYDIVWRMTVGLRTLDACSGRDGSHLRLFTKRFVTAMRRWRLCARQNRSPTFLSVSRAFSTATEYFFQPIVIHDS
jgi:hypothetical protein